MLEELDGLQLADTFAGNQPQKFYFHQSFWLNQALNLTHV